MVPHPFFAANTVCAPEQGTVPGTQHPAYCTAILLYIFLRRIIAENFLEHWWADLDEILSTDKHVDVKGIHKIIA